ncbi:hypothetical protein BDV10DRAFT_179359 [Aspergillus recurvatus]
MAIAYPLISTDHSLEPRQRALRSSWRFEEAEMPSMGAIEVSSDGLYRCPLANCRSRAGFQHKWVLRKHLREHKKPVRCHLCSYSSGTQRDMRRHAEHAHTAWAKQHWRVTAPLFCEICGDSFKRRDSLQRHYRRKHRESLNR